MKTAVVTGCTSGVGLALVEALLEEGWSVFGLARDRSKLQTISARLGVGFEAIECNVGNSQSILRAAKIVGDSNKKIDLLVNNAAVFKMCSFSELTPHEIEEILDTNLKGTILVTHAIMGLLADNRSRIVNIGSVSGLHGIKHQSVYSASKYGLEGFADSLNQELVERGISITTLNPGGIDTPLWNETTNPYPGATKEMLLQMKTIVDMVIYAANLPGNVLLKKIVAFPINEWH